MTQEELTNIKKGDTVTVFFQSTFSGPTKKEHIVIRVYKNSIMIDNKEKFSKKDGRNVIRSPFNIYKIIAIKKK